MIDLSCESKVVDLSSLNRLQSWANAAVNATPNITTLVHILQRRIRFFYYWCTKRQLFS